MVGFELLPVGYRICSALNLGPQNPTPTRITRHSDNPPRPSEGVLHPSLLPVRCPMPRVRPVESRIQYLPPTSFLPACTPHPNQFPYTNPRHRHRRAPINRSLADPRPHRPAAEQGSAKRWKIISEKAGGRARRVEAGRQAGRQEERTRADAHRAHAAERRKPEDEGHRIAPPRIPTPGKDESESGKTTRPGSRLGNFGIDSAGGTISRPHVVGHGVRRRTRKDLTGGGRRREGGTRSDAQ
ncbi:hypothetical protein B0H16DRAFT_1482117 [Mycena metata]|uniref:Uncharacterized protein n=1 Tax=Mycena metata TaxID=1033252 RepID=A0AAD7GUU4_9AGAR|nr:hypothetical protein B0H16DRAFT_1482117 [Mycena metata]